MYMFLNLFPDWPVVAPVSGTEVPGLCFKVYQHMGSLYALPRTGHHRDPRVG